MLDQELERTIVERLRRTYDPRFILLFGSHAWGTPQESSDIDLLVVVRESSEKMWKRPIPGIRSLKGLGIAKDILVLTREEFERMAMNRSSLFFRIKKEGKILYEAA